MTAPESWRECSTTTYKIRAEWALGRRFVPSSLSPAEGDVPQMTVASVEFEYMRHNAAPWFLRSTRVNGHRTTADGTLSPVDTWIRFGKDAQLPEWLQAAAAQYSPGEGS